MITISPEIRISLDTRFSPTGVPEKDTYRISAIIDTEDEYSMCGTLEFENRQDLIALRNALDYYIAANNITAPAPYPVQDDASARLFDKSQASAPGERASAQEEKGGDR